MFKKTNVRFIVIGAAVLLALYSLYWTVAFHSFSDKKTEELRSDGVLEKYENNALHLGLDLQGGMHVVLELDLPKLMQSLAANRTPQFEDVLNTATEQYIASGDDFFDTFRRLADESDLKLVRHFSNRGFKNAEIINNLRDESKDALTRAIQIIRNRVDQFGVSEPNIQKAGQYRIIVELAGVADPERARQLIKSTALLEFTLLKDPAITQTFITAVDNYLKTGQKDQEKPVISPEDTTVAIKESKDQAMSVNELLGVTDASTSAASDSTDSSLVVDGEIFADRPFSSLLRAIGAMIGVPERNVYAVKKILADPEVQKLLPYDSQLLWSAKPEKRTFQDGRTENYYLLYHLNKEAGLQGKYITKANATIGGAGSDAAGRPIISMDMNNEGAKKFAQLTGANIKKFLAIVLDEKVYMAPEISVRIPNGSSYIRGLDSIEEAKDIAIVLRAGALPAPVKTIEERTIGPSLGRDSIRMGIRLGLIGFFLVIIFMAVYYRAAGLLADMALILNLVFVMAILATLGASLTLPGIAGLILTIGMAVDANVLIFERIREELIKGKTVRAAIDSGYSRAFVTILDANITTMLTALILMQFGTGSVKGFAITLFWGILSSMFTAIFVTRTFFNSVTDRKVLQKLSI